MRSDRQMLEQMHRFVAAAEHQIGIDEPEAAGEEHALAGRQAVFRPSRCRSGAPALDHQTTLDRLDGGDDARIVRRQKPDRRQQQQAGVKLLRAIGTHEAAKLGIEPVRAHVGVDTLASFAPLLDRAGQLELFGTSDGAIEGEPGHRPWNT